MNINMKSLAVTALSLAGGTASAMEMSHSLRVGALLGVYSADVKVDAFDSGGNLVASARDDASGELVYGGTFGYRATFGDFYGDIGLDIAKVDTSESFDRTDLLLTGGYFINDMWSVFIGVRRGWQGDGIFNDDAFEELGPFFGGGFGGVNVGGGWTLNAAASINLSKVDNFPTQGQDLDYPGIGLRVGVSPPNSPHALQLRVQSFSGDDKVVFDTGERLEYELKETYVLLSYLYRLAL